MNKTQLSCFENIGNNCEFGFFLRQNGIESGSLFRWALIHNFVFIIDLLSNNFDSLYLYENLQPTYRNMVRYTRYNIDFHTEMLSEQQDSHWEWCYDHAQNYDIYNKEKEKINYLIQKFKVALTDPQKIFVMKQNDLPTLEGAYEIAQIIKQYGKAKLLCVEDTTIEQQYGQVHSLTDNLYLGFVNHFAPYDKSDQVSIYWDKITQSTLRLIDENKGM